MYGCYTSIDNIQTTLCEKNPQLNRCVCDVPDDLFEPTTDRFLLDLFSNLGINSFLFKWKPIFQLTQAWDSYVQHVHRKIWWKINTENGITYQVRVCVCRITIYQLMIHFKFRPKCKWIYEVSGSTVDYNFYIVKLNHATRLLLGMDTGKTPAQKRWQLDVSCLLNRKQNRCWIWYSNSYAHTMYTQTCTRIHLYTPPNNTYFIWFGLVGTQMIWMVVNSHELRACECGRERTICGITVPLQ